MTGQEKDCSLGDAENVAKLLELDAFLKTKAQQGMDYSRRHPEDADVLMRFVGDLIQQAKGVRMAIELVKGGKLLAGVLVPASSLGSSRTENVDSPSP